MIHIATPSTSQASCVKVQNTLTNSCFHMVDLSRHPLGKTPTVYVSRQAAAYGFAIRNKDCFLFFAFLNYCFVGRWFTAPQAFFVQHNFCMQLNPKVQAPFPELGQKSFPLDKQPELRKELFASWCIRALRNVTLVY
mmetsp:Transcript_5484/g.6684  ORF Transcript_5484/g.6684 Transcript_5484/m.6684 type:complete len:137 (-) Transcript_5484:1108-1518(-)